ncbi:MAG TPA: thioredoxin fold domain-containing protein [Micavibrio sp.]
MSQRSRSFATLLSGLSALVIMSSVALAQTTGAEAPPPMPAPLETLAKQGAQLRYLGRQGQLDGWIAIQNGQEQYFYVTPDREQVLLGLLFDKTGKMITMDQVAKLQKEGGEVLDILKSAPRAEAATPQSSTAGDITKELKSPSEQMFADIEQTNWVTLGNTAAPVVYMFIDPQCPYCHDFMKSLRKDIEGGRVQVRLIPVGFRDDTRAQAALLLAVPNAQERWFKHLDGDQQALPVTPGVNEQGVERNMAVMQSWKLNVTPLSVYRAQDGKVKIVQGRAKDLKAFVSDLQKTP